MQITRNVSATADVTTSASASAVYSVVGSASAQTSFAVDVAYNRIKAFSATEPVGFAVSAVSRYKWLEADEPANTWTVAAYPSTTWVDADYLERAA